MPMAQRVLGAGDREADALKLLAQYQEWNALRSENKPIPKEFAGFQDRRKSRMSSGSFIPYLSVV